MSKKIKQLDLMHQNSSYYSELNENQFIKPVKDDTEIDFNGGNLNLISPDNGKVTV